MDLWNKFMALAIPRLVRKINNWFSLGSRSPMGSLENSPCQPVFNSAFQVQLGYPVGASGREPAYQYRRLERWVRSLGWEDPLEDGMAIHPRILAWRIPWTASLVGYSPQGCKELGMSEATQHNMHASSFYLRTQMSCEYSLVSSLPIPGHYFAPTCQYASYFKLHGNYLTLYLCL